MFALIQKIRQTAYAFAWNNTQRSQYLSTLGGFAQPSLENNYGTAFRNRVFARSGTISSANISIVVESVFNNLGNRLVTLYNALTPLLKDLNLNVTTSTPPAFVAGSFVMHTLRQLKQQCVPNKP